MRPIAMGRRNSLFSGSEGGAESWAILASLVNTAKLHELDPQTYLVDVLERIVSGQTKSHQLHELLPWNWKAARALSLSLSLVSVAKRILPFKIWVIARFSRRFFLRRTCA
jgi:hypothetical protein